MLTQPRLAWSKRRFFVEGSFYLILCMGLPSSSTSTYREDMSCVRPYILH